VAKLESMASGDRPTRPEKDRAEAEAKGDAGKRMAFVSTRMPPSEESARLADKAVAARFFADVDLFITRRDLRYAYRGITQARQWAPTPTMGSGQCSPYLVEASLRASDLDPIFVRRAVQRMKNLVHACHNATQRGGHNAEGVCSAALRLLTMLALDRARKKVLAALGSQKICWNTGVVLLHTFGPQPIRTGSLRAGDGRTEAGRPESAEARPGRSHAFAQRIQANAKPDWEKFRRWRIYWRDPTSAWTLMASQGRTEEAGALFSRGTTGAGRGRNDRQRHCDYANAGIRRSIAEALFFCTLLAAATGSLARTTCSHCSGWLWQRLLRPPARASLSRGLSMGTARTRVLLGALLLLIVGINPLRGSLRSLFWSATDAISVTWLASIELFWGPYCRKHCGCGAVLQPQVSSAGRNIMKWIGKAAASGRRSV